MTPSGKYNRRVTIRRRSVGQDASGQPIQSWENVATLWASVLTQTGRESIKSDRPVSEVMASIRIRWRTDIVADMQAMLGTSIYDIKAIIPDERNRAHVDLVCELVS